MLLPKYEREHIYCTNKDSKCPAARRVWIVYVNRWDEFYTARSATTTNENGLRWQYAVTRRVVQRSSALLVLESPWMSLTRDALWYNGL